MALRKLGFIMGQRDGKLEIHDLLWWYVFVEVLYVSFNICKTV
jgi:hypothetical protein